MRDLRPQRLKVAPLLAHPLCKSAELPLAAGAALLGVPADGQEREAHTQGERALRNGSVMYKRRAGKQQQGQRSATTTQAKCGASLVEHKCRVGLVDGIVGQVGISVDQVAGAGRLVLLRAEPHLQPAAGVGAGTESGPDGACLAECGPGGQQHNEGLCQNRTAAPL